MIVGSKPDGFAESDCASVPMRMRSPAVPVKEKKSGVFVSTSVPVVGIEPSTMIGEAVEKSWFVLVPVPVLEVTVTPVVEVTPLVVLVVPPVPVVPVLVVPDVVVVMTHPPTTTTPRPSDNVDTSKLRD